MARVPFSPHNDAIKRISINESSIVRPEQTMLMLKYCPHEMDSDGLDAFYDADLTLIAKTRHKQRKIAELSGAALTQLMPTIMSAPAGMRDMVPTNQELFTVGVFSNQPTEEVRVWTDKTTMVIEYCPHEMEFKGLCACCGADRTLIAKTRHKSTAASKHLPAPMASKHVLCGNQHGQRKRAGSDADDEPDAPLWWRRGRRRRRRR